MVIVAYLIVTIHEKFTSPLKEFAQNIMLVHISKKVPSSQLAQINEHLLLSPICDEIFVQLVNVMT